jgi:hypothetical protein
VEVNEKMDLCLFIDCNCIISMQDRNFSYFLNKKWRFCFKLLKLDCHYITQILPRVGGYAGARAQARGILQIPHVAKQRANEQENKLLRNLLE